MRLPDGTIPEGSSFTVVSLASHMPYNPDMGRKEITAGAERLPDFFPQGRTQYYYVDKTGFILDLISAGFLDSFPQLILRPRRFGKTLTLSMLRTFFDREEKDKDWIFSSLEISRHVGICKQYQNKYPVIAVSF